jgi:HK97 family phage prohead protease
MKEQSFIRAYCKREAMAESGPVRFVASTEDVARDGMVIEAAGWQLEPYRSNPVVLWAHDYSKPPIGKATVTVEDKRLMADVEFDQGDELAREIERKYRQGYLNAVSVGWRTLEMAPGREPRITKAELLDVSAVPVPADPGALAERQVRGMHDLGRELLNVARPEARDLSATELSVWRGVASAMLALYCGSDDVDEGARRGLYNALERAYQKLGKEPPEYMAARDLADMGQDNRLGLFLEGEADMPDMPDTRAGQVLSSRNRGDLEQAITLIQSVLDRAKTEKAAEDKDQEPERAAGADLQAILEKLNKIG